MINLGTSDSRTRVECGSWGLPGVGLVHVNTGKNSKTYFWRWVSKRRRVCAVGVGQCVVHKSQNRVHFDGNLQKIRALLAHLVQVRVTNLIIFIRIVSGICIKFPSNYYYFNCLSHFGLNQDILFHKQCTFIQWKSTNRTYRHCVSIRSSSWCPKHFFSKRSPLVNTKKLTTILTSGSLRCVFCIELRALRLSDNIRTQRPGDRHRLQHKNDRRLEIHALSSVRRRLRRNVFVSICVIGSIWTTRSEIRCI